MDNKLLSTLSIHQTAIPKKNPVQLKKDKKKHHETAHQTVYQYDTSVNTPQFNTQELKSNVINHKLRKRSN